MFRNWTFGNRLTGGFICAAFTLALIISVAHRTTARLIENNALVEHTHEVSARFSDVFSLIKEAEAGQRGYLITGNDDYLAPYRDAVGQLPAVLDQMRRLTADNASQQQRIDALAPLVETRLAEMARTLDVHRSQGFEAAQRIILDGSGRQSMLQIRSLITKANQEEAELLAQRDAAAEASARQAMDLIVWGGIGGVLLIGVVGWLTARALHRQIGAVVGHVQSSSAELQSAANQQASGVKEQVASMNEINTTISELLATSRQIAESAQRVAQIAGDATAAARSGEGVVARADESILGIRRQVDQIVAHMLELGRKSQEIGSVLDIVTELAEQTNILSINATIEAAGAGEAGKRFATVADEIRKLADRVGGSAKEIRSLIEEVRSSVNTTVMATETGSKAVDGGSKQFGEVASLFKQIVALVGTTMEAAREIELSTKQQTTAVEQVNIATANVAQATRETEASAGQTIQTAAELASTSRDLLRLVRARLAA